MVGGRDRAEKRTGNETDIEENQQPLPVEAVGIPGGQQAGRTGAEGVYRDQQAELGGGDRERRHDHRPEGRENHEIQDDRKLQKGDQGDDEALVARQGRGGSRISNHGVNYYTQNCSPSAARIDSREQPPRPAIKNVRLDHDPAQVVRALQSPDIGP
jgi:hypothetical protein